MSRIRYNIEPNWHDIKQAYETDETMSARAIARKYKITPQRLYNRVKKEGWQKPLGRVVSPAISGDKGVTDFVKAFVTRILKENESVAQVSEWYKDQRAMLLRQSQISDLALLEAIRNSITKKDMKDWTPGQKSTWFGVLSKDLKDRYLEERLEEEQSTENVGVLYKHILVMQKRDAIDVTPGK